MYGVICFFLPRRDEVEKYKTDPFNFFVSSQNTLIKPKVISLKPRSRSLSLLDQRRKVTRIGVSWEPRCRGGAPRPSASRPRSLSHPPVDIQSKAVPGLRAPDWPLLFIDSSSFIQTSLLFQKAPAFPFPYTPANGRKLQATPLATG